MNPFSAQMTASIIPGDKFVDFYSSVMHNYLERKEKHSKENDSAYDQVAQTVIKMCENKSIYEVIEKSPSLYILPQSNSTQRFKLDDFFNNKSKPILQHEFLKWFGTEKIANALISELDNVNSFLNIFFSIAFFSFQLDLSHNKKEGLYLTISPGKDFKRWLSKITENDLKVSLNLLKDTPSPMFDSFTTFVIKTDILKLEELDEFLKKNIDTIIEYQHMAWLGKADTTHNKQLQWPSNLHELSTFKNWFLINVHEDVILL